MQQRYEKYPQEAGRGQAAIIACAVLWSTSGLCIKLLDWHPMVIAGTRSAVAAALLYAVLRKRRALGKGGTLEALGTGALYAATMITFVIANKLTSSANAILLQYSAPVWAAVFGWALMKEKLSWGYGVILALVMAGLFIFFRENLAGGALLGDSVSVFSGICLGAYSVLMRRLKQGNTADAMLWSHVLCALLSAVFVFRCPPSLNPAGLAAIAYMGIAQIGVASLLFAYGIKRVKAVPAMLTAMIEPVLNPVWVLIVTGERPSASALAGGGLIIAAVAFSALRPGAGKSKAP
jgi:drug/metabolite transporter (DMT)-like permease